jgi:hypothetical protein
VGWLDEDDQFSLATCGWLAHPAPLCDLRSILILPPAEGVANFDDQILLVEAVASPGELSPGGTSAVQLRWRALRRLAEDYTVFVQLVGPDGRLHGQADAWPVQGTYPTSQWDQGEEVDDLYEVRLDGNAPPGKYQVHAGWYLLETMERLPLVNEAGRWSGDSIIVGEFRVPLK